MELTIERFKNTKDYTLSRIYEIGLKKLFVLDLVEPPPAGLTDSALTTLKPGRYKMYLKTDNVEYDIVAVFQSIPQQERLSFMPIEQPAYLDKVTWESGNAITRYAIKSGRLKGNTLLDDRESFSRFIMRCIIAKQNKETLWINIK